MKNINYCNIKAEITMKAKISKSEDRKKNEISTSCYMKPI